KVKKSGGKDGGRGSKCIYERKIHLDGILVANETIEFLKCKRHKGLIFKVDFEKAHDIINREFLLNIMKRTGFEIKWHKWAENCLKSSSMSVLVDESPTEEFKFEREALDMNDGGSGIEIGVGALVGGWMLQEIGEFTVKALARLMEEKTYESRVNTFRLKYFDGSIEILNRIKLKLGIENMFLLL
nr:cysteine-rich receptor-like protein kinase [Tanacetum cinerariifolium]